MTRIDLEYAYPFMSLAFIIVMVFGVVFLGHVPSLAKIMGTLRAVAGLTIVARA